MCQKPNGGGAFLINDGNGYFELVDSIFSENGFPPVNGEFFDNNNFIDIFFRYVSFNPYKENIGIIYNYGSLQFDSIKIFFLYLGDNNFGTEHYSSGDVNGDGFNDIVFACNIGHFWGVIYNDGTGNFSEPEYFDLDFPPVDIKCTDLNKDGRSDVIVSGSDTEIYFSTETGFQQQLLTETLNSHVLISDFDNDNDNDIILETTFFANHHRVYMFENIGHNNFFEHDYFDFIPFCSNAQIADFNNDSLPDIVFIARDHSGLFIYNNIGDFNIEYWQFIPYEKTNPSGMFCEDYDNNGFIDIAFTSGVGGIDYYLNILFNDGKGNFVEDPVGIIEKEEKQKDILSCYPNPFSEYVNFEFSIIKQNSIDLSIYDINGKKIKLITNKIYSPGKYKLMWNGKCKNGKEVKAGIYFVSFTVNEKFIQSMKLIKK